MDEIQEQLLKRLTLLKQKIREQYPELSEKMTNEHLNKLWEEEDKIQDARREECLVPVHKKKCS
ncbi:MAG: hypothetical protein H7141_07955 [Burkholderiales bacterium]|nr:hypothetical protein [Bacteroidia bacterium]